MGETPARIRGFVAHARRVPAAERTRLAGHARTALAGRGLILETCHRIEGYGATDGAIDALDGLRLPHGTVEVVDRSAIRHAIAVAVGRDSVVVGEDQIVHQLRESVDAARASGGLDPVLERLFATALHAGRRARSWRQGPQASLATVALTAIEDRRGPLRGEAILVVGAGQMGRLAARTAAGAGISVAVANRSAAAASDLARQVGGRSVSFDPGVEAGSYAAILVAMRGPWPIGIAATDALAHSGAIVVDLSVPTSLDRRLSRRLGNRLVTSDDLARADAAGQSETGAMRRLDSLIDRTTAEFIAWIDGRDGRAAAAALASAADELRTAELEILWRQLPDLDADAREVIDAMTRHFAARLLREPLERLGNDPDGRTERAIREVFAL